MKKLLLVTGLVLSSIISYGQIIEKQTTYVIKMTEQEYNNYLNNKEVKPTTQSKVHIVETKKKDVNPINHIKSFGLEGGYSMFMGVSNLFSPSWGAWIDFGKVGVEYHANVGVNTIDIGASNFISGKTDEWIAGGVSKSIGVFGKSRNLYYGGGVQFTEIIGVKNTLVNAVRNGVLYGTQSIPTVTDENKVYPYATIGYIGNLGESFTLKSGVVISKISSVNVGIGYNFN